MMESTLCIMVMADRQNLPDFFLNHRVKGSLIKWLILLQRVPYPKRILADELIRVSDRCGFRL